MIALGEVSSFEEVETQLVQLMRDAPVVTTERWQGIEHNQTTKELINVSFAVNLHGIESLDHWRGEINPNVDWCNAVFNERVGGEPLNPGEAWTRWPNARSADKFRDPAGRFNHSYPERLWPKYARRTRDGKLPVTGTRRKPQRGSASELRGLAMPYGDLLDLVHLLVDQPHTRQAYIPLFWPEDTGRGDGGRKMCSLGYQVLARDGDAHIWYPLRSCDFVRHWADDCYLAVRMLIWIIGECRKRSRAWWDIKPGEFAFHATSLHAFVTDKI